MHGNEKERKDAERDFRVKAPPEARRGPVPKIGVGPFAKGSVEIAHVGEIGVRNPVVAPFVHGLRQDRDRNVAHHFGRSGRKGREHQVRIERGGAAATVARGRAVVDDSKFMGSDDARRHGVLPLAGRQNPDVGHAERHHLQNVGVIPFGVDNLAEEFVRVFPLLGQLTLRYGASLKGVRVGRRDGASLEVGEGFERTSRTHEKDRPDRAVRFLSIRTTARRDLLQIEFALAHGVAARQNHKAVGAEARGIDRFAPREFDRGEAVLRIAHLEALDERGVGVDEEARIEGVDDPDRDVGHGGGFGRFERRRSGFGPRQARGKETGQEKEREGRSGPHGSREKGLGGLTIIRTRKKPLDPRKERRAERIVSGPGALRAPSPDSVIRRDGADRR